jgi:hypothetical protein
MELDEIHEGVSQSQNLEGTGELVRNKTRHDPHHRKAGGHPEIGERVGDV